VGWQWTCTPTGRIDVPPIILQHPFRLGVRKIDGPPESSFVRPAYDISQGTPQNLRSAIAFGGAPLKNLQIEGAIAAIPSFGWANNKVGRSGSRTLIPTGVERGWATAIQLSFLKQRMTGKPMLTSLKTLAALAGLAVALNCPVPAEAAVRTGTLTCDIGGGTNVIVASQKTLSCRYDSIGGRHEVYAGEISKFGVDLSATTNGRLVWAVFEAALVPGGLAGTYGGVLAEATVGVGVGANVLVGGGNGGVTLQPLSLQGQSGFGLAAGIGSMTLTANAPPVETIEIVQRPRHHYIHHHYVHHYYTHHRRPRHY
jgi:hypothetical protein